MNIVNNADIALIESFKGKFRVECLNQNWFLLLVDARDRIESWRMDYNHYRPRGPDLPGYDYGGVFGGLLFWARLSSACPRTKRKNVKTSHKS